HLVELPAVVDEADHRPHHVEREGGGDAEREQLGIPAHAGSHHVQPQTDADQLAVAEGVAYGEESRRRAQPGGDVLCAADQDARLAAERLREHHHADGGEAERGERAAGGVEAVEEPPHYLLLRYALITPWPSAPAF